ncbi:MAG TPA: hypothetical protein VF097_07885 [Actinomycetota bacterium]
MKALVISADPDVRRQLEVALRSAGRQASDQWEFLEASNGVQGIRVAWRELPDLVVADEIASGAGAFAAAKDLRGQMRPFPGAIIIVLARPQDAWLARWAGADAWVTKPVDPFELADHVVRLTGRQTVEEGA